MRLRRAAVLAAALLTLILGPANAIAVQPTSAPDAGVGLAGVERGTSGTFDLADGGHVHVMRTPAAAARARAAASGTLSTNNGISYWGGPVVPAEHVVSIYWASTQVFNGGPTPGTSGLGSADGSLVGYYLNQLGGSNYYNINTTYGDAVGGGHTVANAISYTGFWADNGATAPAVNSSPTDAQIQAEIGHYFTSTGTTPDPSTVYAVFSASGVNLGGGAYTQYCAYHGDFNWNGSVVLYAVMPYDYHSGCTVLSGSPNNDYGSDAEVNVLSHELEEANTDPRLNAWFDSTGAENGDKCAWNFGTEFLSTKNGNGYANITVGGRDWLVQQNWLNANGGGCYQGYTSPAPSVLTTVKVAPSSASVTTGGTQQFAATGYDQYGAVMSPQPSFTWSISGGGTIAQATGLFTAGSTGGGPFTVTAASGSASGTAMVTVTVLSKVTVTPASASVVAGGTRQFTATAYDQNNQVVSPTPSYSWSVSGGGTISATGVFIAGSLAGGPYTVTASVSGSSVAGTASVTVTSDFSVSVSPTSQTVRRGSTATYGITITPIGGFNGSVTLSLTGAPSGSSFTFSPNNAQMTSSTLTVPTLSSTTRTTYTLTITAVSGSLTHTYKVSLKVR